jgi:hypothetical protein
MKTIGNMAFAAILGAAALALASSQASARIVCNGEGDCWHTTTEYVYPPTVHLLVHPDAWRWGDHDHYVWHEHEGRGFWHGGHWEDF